MRGLSYLFWALSILAGIGWVGLYVWIHGMASAFVASGAVRIAPPWALRGEDAIVLLLAPATLVGALVLAAVLAGRAATRRAAARLAGRSPPAARSRAPER